MRALGMVQSLDTMPKTADVACAGQERVGELRSVQLIPRPIDKLIGASGF